MFKTYKDFINALQSKNCLERVLAIEEVKKQVRPKMWSFFIVATGCEIRAIKGSRAS